MRYCAASSRVLTVEAHSGARGASPTPLPCPQPVGTTPPPFRSPSIPSQPPSFLSAVKVTHPVHLAQRCKILHLAVPGIVTAKGLVGRHHQVVVTGNGPVIPGRGEGGADR